MRSALATNLTATFPFLRNEAFGNTMLSYLTGLLILALGITLVMVIQFIIFGRLKRLAEKTRPEIDDFVVELGRKNLVPLLYFGTFYLATRVLNLGAFLDNIIRIAAIILLSIFAIRIVSSLARFFITNRLIKREKDEKRLHTFKSIIPMVNIIIWIIGALFLMGNLGFDISTVVAGLGIGGIAVALAAQAVLGDMFSYFSILLDRPFELGDFIIVGDFMGTVEKIGVKTTRIRSLGGEQLIFSNTDLTNSRVRNYKRMQTRRVVFSFGVVYQTPLAQIKMIPSIVKEIIDSLGGEAVFDRAHFQKYGNSSLDFEAVYIAQTADYNRYMDLQQEINLALFERFAKEKIEFAYPTQVVYVNQPKPKK
ncbi:MAG: mechanosensitive ion channel family protein [Brevinematales bacterium]|nr:mechanosensitive ion channel family protein [Brevinematales bacterium]